MFRTLLFLANIIHKPVFMKSASKFKFNWIKSDVSLGKLRSYINLYTYYIHNS